MKSVLLKGESNEDLSLLIKLAHKLGIEVRYLKSGELEDIALGYAIKEGENEDELNVEEFKKSLLEDES